VPVATQELWYTFKILLKVDSNQGAMFLLSGARKMPVIVSDDATDLVERFKVKTSGGSADAMPRKTSSLSNRLTSKARVPVPAVAPTYTDRLFFRPEKRYACLRCAVSTVLSACLRSAGMTLVYSLCWASLVTRSVASAGTTHLSSTSSPTE
jgi:hypothetical protein